MRKEFVAICKKCIFNLNEGQKYNCKEGFDYTIDVYVKDNGKDINHIYIFNQEEYKTYFYSNKELRKEKLNKLKKAT